MRLAISSQGQSLTSKLDPHFGRAKYFIVIDVEGGQFTVYDNQDNVNAAQGAGIQTAKWVIDWHVDAVITGHVGPKAAEVLGAADITIYECKDSTIEEAVKQYEACTLTIVEPVIK